MNNESEPNQKDFNNLSDECQLAPFECSECDGTNNFDGWESTCDCACHTGKSEFQNGIDINEDLLVKASKRVKYTVYVDDNYRYMDESERYTLGEFETAEVAVNECKKIIDDFLLSGYTANMTADELYHCYQTFGEDPFISSGDKDCKFSAWTYAKERCTEICEQMRNS